MRRRLGATVVALALSIGAGSALTACSSVERAGAAAVVDGEIISEADLDAAVTDLRTANVEGVTPPVVLFYLIVAPTMETLAAAPGGWRPDESYNNFMATIPGPSPSTVAVVRSNYVFNALSDAGKTEVARQLETKQIEVNPRYGTFEASILAVAPGAPEWIAPPAPQGNNEPAPEQPAEPVEPTAPATP